MKSYKVLEVPLEFFLGVQARKNVRPHNHSRQGFRVQSSTGERRCRGNAKQKDTVDSRGGKIARRLLCIASTTLKGSASKSRGKEGGLGFAWEVASMGAKKTQCNKYFYSHPFIRQENILSIPSYLAKFAWRTSRPLKLFPRGLFNHI